MNNYSVADDPELGALLKLEWDTVGNSAKLTPNDARYPPHMRGQPLTPDTCNSKYSHQVSWVCSHCQQPFSMAPASRVKVGGC